MNIGYLIHNLSEEEKCIVRKIEKINRKLVNVKYALVFNKQCIKENLLPAYTNIYIYIYMSGGLVTVV